MQLTMQVPWLVACVIGLGASIPADAADPWAGQTFLGNYSQLQPLPRSRTGNDYAYVVPEHAQLAGRYRKVMLDQPEVFISPHSPYKGAKPEDVAALAAVVRSTIDAALTERGYVLVDEPGADTLYVRLAVTDLQIQKKKRKLLAYTPVGFVVDAGVKALQGFMDQYDLLDVGLQAEIHDSTSQQVLAAAVLQRGKSAAATEPLAFDTVVAVTNELGERFACRLDNTYVHATERIDCADPVARKSRPKVVGN
jgi:hypothetical protein